MPVLCIDKIRLFLVSKRNRYLRYCLLVDALTIIICPLEAFFQLTYKLLILKPALSAEQQ